jgi:hypothetical protein
MRIMTTAAAAAAALAVGGCATTDMVEAESCERDCLIDVAGAYINALIDHDPSAAPLAPDIVTVENVERIQPGEGLWSTADGARDGFTILVPDPVVQAVGYLGVMRMGDKPVVVAIRLQLEDGLIVEAEHLVTNEITNESALANLQTLRPGLSATVPPGERMRRDQLVAIAGAYYDALEGDSSALSPFADDCERRENGIRTAYPGDWENIDPTEFGYFSAVGCARQLDTGVMGYIDRLDNRRVFAADPVTGLAMGLSHFRHAMNFDTIPIRNVPGVTEREMSFDPFDLPAAHVYKITNGQIHEIEAMGFTAPYMSPTGWEN